MLFIHALAHVDSTGTYTSHSWFKVTSPSVLLLLLLLLRLLDYNYVVYHFDYCTTNCSNAHYHLTIITATTTATPATGEPVGLEPAGSAGPERDRGLRARGPFGSGEPVMGLRGKSP